MAVDGSLKGVERRGLMFVLSSPSGAGKSTLARMLIEKMPGLIMSVSVTTRPMRPGEVDGEHYHFIDQARFHAMVKDGELLGTETHAQSPATRSYTLDQALALYRAAGFAHVGAYHEFTFEPVEPADTLFCVVGSRPL